MSRATGWGINSKDGGFQYNIEFEDQENGPGLFLSKEEHIPKDKFKTMFSTTGIILLLNST